MRARTLLAAVSFLAVPAPAGAVAPQVVAVTASGYAPSEVVVAAGGSLTLVSADATDFHDLVSHDSVNGVRLFESSTIGGGGVAGVSGVSALRPGTYPFFCSVHEWMAGNLTVLGTD